MECARLLLSMAVLGACRPPVGETTPPAGDPVLPTAPLSWEVDAAAFEGAPSPVQNDLFSMVSADMDRDGDLDLLINRHLDVPMELFDNQDGHYVLRNPKGADTSGIYDNPGVPDLYGEADVLLAEADAAGPGVYVWHDPSRGSHWHVYTIPEPGGEVPAMRVTVNRPLIDIQGDVTRTLIDAFVAEVAPVDASSPTHFDIDSELVGTQLVLELLTDDPPTAYVGTTRAPIEGGRISLWKPDPHGLAWHDVVGGEGLELFVTRGGLIGNLLPPHEPKVDQLFVYTDGDALYEQDATAVPPSYGRGRQLAWVDLDGDGRDELYIGNTKTDNVLLDDPGTGRFEDRAPELGLDLLEGDAFAWLDVDADGWPDLVYSDVTELMVARNGAGAGFTHEPGAALGLVSPAGPEDVAEGIFDPFTFQVFDYDGDGDQDLWVSDWGNRHQVAVFRNDGGAFTEVTGELGLAGVDHFAEIVLADLDHDGWTDVVGVDEGLHFWRNLGGLQFADQDVPVGGGLQAYRNAIATDVDGDGLVDLVGSAGETRWVVRNTTEVERSPLMIDVVAPLGSVVAAEHSDGTATTWQWGAVDNSRYSQSVRPLHAGSRPGQRVVSVQVTTPAGQVVQVEVGADDERIRVEAP